MPMKVYKWSRKESQKQFGDVHEDVEMKWKRRCDQTGPRTLTTKRQHNLSKKSEIYERTGQNKSVIW
jgi:hypothetical protein